MKKRFFLILSLMVTAVLPLAARITLAGNGKTAYRVILPESPTEMEKEAGRDLRMTLCKITGAPFKYASWKHRSQYGHRLFIGVKAPGDSKPLAQRERRVRFVGSDIYLYGSTRDDNAFAVYDFLGSLGCRWFTARGISRIPPVRELEVSKKDLDVIPSFSAPHLSGGAHAMPKKLLDDYARRNRIYARSSGEADIGPNYAHIPGKLVPPGDRFKKQTGLWEPYKYSRNDSYFADHPEYFSLNAKGTRVPDKQLCYTNKDLRKLLNAKLQEIIDREYKGGPARIRCDLNDNNGFESITICYCKECMELVKKYRSPAGPYWDFTIEFCKRLQKEYPQIYVTASAYLSAEIPPAVEKLPGNLRINLAPLNKSYTKPFDHPDNANILNRLTTWSKICSSMTLQLYPSIYNRATTTLPLLANLRQLAQNLRICKKYGIVNIYAEQGHPWAITGAFNELRQYMLSRLFNNAGLDENLIIEEYMRHVYGSAAGNMIAYWQELEKLEAAESGCTLNWYGLNIDTLSYLTAENLTRWSRLFDTMEKETAGEAAALTAVKEARTNLDEAILAAHRRMPQTPEFAPELLADRIRKTIRNSHERMRRHYSSKSLAKQRIESLCKRQILNGVDFLEALARKPRPLPDEFKKYPAENIIRTLPGKCTSGRINHLRHIFDDDKAPYGVYLKGSRPANDRMIRVLTSCIVDTSGRRYLVEMEHTKSYHSSVIKKHPGEYRYYYFGRTKLYRTQSLLIHTFDSKRHAWVQLGQYFDPADPDIEYDLYCAIAPDADGTLRCAEIVLVNDGKRGRVTNKPVLWAAAG